MTSPHGSSASAADEPAGEVELADRVADVVRAVPGVADLHGGVFGEVATYLPGRQVAGVRIDDDHVDVHIAVVWNEPVRATAEQVSAQVEEIVGRPVFVTVDDVVHPDFPSDAAAAPRTMGHAKNILDSKDPEDAASSSVTKRSVAQGSERKAEGATATKTSLDLSTTPTTSRTPSSTSLSKDHLS